MTIEEIFRAIKQLSPGEQKLLYEELSTTVNNEEGDAFYGLAFDQLTNEQYDEIKRRYNTVNNGEICLIEMEDHFYHLQNL